MSASTRLSVEIVRTPFGMTGTYDVLSGCGWVGLKEQFRQVDLLRGRRPGERGLVERGARSFVPCGLLHRP